MKKYVAFFLFLLGCVSVFAQEDELEKKYALRSSTMLLDVSTVSLMDNYLSPLPYDGIGLKFITESSRLFSPENINLSSISRFNVNLGTAVNPAGTASIMYLGFNYGWGMFYHFRPLNNLQILTGGIADLDLGVKYNARNVNNPVNVDLAFNTNLAVRIIYDIPARRRTYRLQGELESPLLGFMFVPEQGASYYEIFLLRAKGHFIHFTSFHNRQSLRQRYFVEIPFYNSTWRFGFTGNILKYKANDMHFKKNDFSLFVGYTRALYSFTRKNKAPENFISY